jgi:hypothetical protein
MLCVGVLGSLLQLAVNGNAAVDRRLDGPGNPALIFQVCFLCVIVPPMLNVCIAGPHEHTNGCADLSSHNVPDLGTHACANTIADCQPDDTSANALADLGTHAGTNALYGERIENAVCDRGRGAASTGRQTKKERYAPPSV